MNAPQSPSNSVINAGIPNFAQTLDLDTQTDSAWYILIDQYRCELANQPNDPDLFFRLANALHEVGQLSAAITNYRMAVRLHHPYVSGVHLALSEALTQYGSTQEAANAYLDALRAEPTNLNWQQERIKSLEMELGSLQDRSMPDESMIALLLKLSRRFRGFGDFQLAASFLLWALEIDPNHNHTLTQLQFTPIEASNRAQVIKAYWQAIPRSPNFRIWGNLGDALMADGDHKQAFQCYQTCRRLNLERSLPSTDYEERHDSHSQTPDYLGIGPAKCGTTSLYQALDEHPLVVHPHKKEISFFDLHYDRGIDWYLSQFPAVDLVRHDRTSKLVTGEISPNYFVTAGVEERVQRLFPKIRLLVILRNPIERAISSFFFRRDLGIETRNLAEVVAQELEIHEQFSHAPRLPGGLLYSGLYYEHLLRWKSVFAQEQILVLQTEKLIANPEEEMSRVFDFLELPSVACRQLPRCNVGQYSASQIDMGIRRQLAEFFKPRNEKLFELLGRDFGWNEQRLHRTRRSTFFCNR